MRLSTSCALLCARAQAAARRRDCVGVASRGVDLPGACSLERLPRASTRCVAGRRCACSYPRSWSCSSVATPRWISSLSKKSLPRYFGVAPCSHVQQKFLLRLNNLAQPQRVATMRHRLRGSAAWHLPAGHGWPTCAGGRLHAGPPGHRQLLEGRAQHDAGGEEEAAFLLHWQRPFANPRPGQVRSASPVRASQSNLTCFVVFSSLSVPETEGCCWIQFSECKMFVRSRVHAAREKERHLTTERNKRGVGWQHDIHH